MKISCKETLFTYNVYHTVKAFFPEAEIEQRVDAGQEPLVELELDGGSCFCILPADVRACAEMQEIADARGDARSGGTAETREAVCKKEAMQAQKREVTRLVYRFLSQMTGKELAWGVLTGVRPTKLATQLVVREGSEERAVDVLRQDYAVAPSKARLAVEIAGREKALLAPLDIRHGFSLYVGIPFCPSICSYCSFGSSPLDLWKGQVDAYLDVLCKELSVAAAQMRGRKLNTVYIGGGTPTTLEAGQLERLLRQVDESFSAHMGAGGLLEYTVEAGRPDSVTREKLEVLRSHPVSRISINPQTMQQRTLDLVGRRHTVQDVRDGFHMARKLGFDNINMDLIVGLPGERIEDVRDTLRQVEELGPDSLTVHSLAIKRAARMGQEKRNSGHAGQKDGTGDMGVQDGKLHDTDMRNGKLHDMSVQGGNMPEAGRQEEIEAMVEAGAMSASRMGLLPYYLYRQKDIAGNFENVGYAKVDKAGIYNILIMEEVQTIVACGAGSISKRIYPDGNIRRCENVKNVFQYMERIDEMIGRKRELLTAS